MAIEAVQVVQDLAIVMTTALAMAFVFHRIHQPPLIGYILAGMAIGPYTPPFSLVTHPEVLDLLAQIGIVFLLLAVGLEYPVARLRAVGRKALAIALTENLATFAAGFLVAQAFGFSRFDSLFLGLAASVTSTVILARLLEDRGLLADGVAGLVLGVTVLEDIIAVSALGVLQSLATTGTVALLSVLLAVGLVVAFVVLTLLIGSRLVPRLIDLAAGTGRNDLLLLAVLALALGLSVLSNLIGISVATGAFLAGVLVAESRSQASAKVLVTPLKELFGAVFFVSIGALMDIELLPAVLLPVAALLATSIGAKYGATYLAARRERMGPTDAHRAAITLAGPRGELSLVVAKGGADIGATSAVVLPIVGAMALVTSFLSPYLVRIGWRGSGPSPVSAQSPSG
ncbi:MAG TPA: cation:proton antiporter [Thermoplasmata archaeon]|nr:cation:proton antiporter [Thermoplasmata archaeon]